MDLVNHFKGNFKGRQNWLIFTWRQFSQEQFNNFFSI